MSAALRRSGALLAGLLLAVGCHGGGSSESAQPTPTAIAGTPVQVAEVTLADLAETVSAPGRTEALVTQQVRAPFAGTVTELAPVVGDRVTKGERVGTMVARDAEAALEGARQMVREATGPRERADAERALELARRNLVVTPLESSAAGVVVSRSAASGDRVAQDAELLGVAAADSLVFVADLAQSDLARVHPGQAATVALTGRTGALPGTVHGVMATANAAAMTVPVRIDLASPGAVPAVGMFGTVRITVAHRRQVPVVPDAAVLTDDVTGVKRLAEVADGKAHWVEVATGLAEDGRVEITRPTLSPGTQVIVGGQVGLPDGAPVVTGR